MAGSRIYLGPTTEIVIDTQVSIQELTEALADASGQGKHWLALNELNGSGLQLVAINKIVAVQSLS